MADEADALGGRLEDIFQDEIAPRIKLIENFVKFARSCDGLGLEEIDISEIQQDYKDNVREQKMKMLFRWQEKEGVDAKPGKICNILDNFLMKHRDELTGDEANIAKSTIYVTESIPVAGQCSVVGGCKFTFPKSWLTEKKTVCLSYGLDSTPPPDGYIHATSFVQCRPCINPRKAIQCDIHTWCSSNHSVDIPLFTKNTDGSWDKVQSPFAPFPGETHLDYSARQLSCVKGFIHEERLKDVEFSISCFLYCNADGRFAMAFCLQDDPIQKYVLGNLEEGFTAALNIDPIKASIGDEVAFHITPGQLMKNTKFLVDKKFVSSINGYTVYCNLDKKAKDPEFVISVKQRGGKVDYEKRYGIEGFGCGKTGHSKCKVSLIGNIDAENFIGETGDVHIDQRKYEGTDNKRGSKPFWENNELAYQKTNGSKVEKNIEKKVNITQNSPSLSIIGNVRAKTVIGKAGKVYIDQRKNKTNNPPPSAGSGRQGLVAEQRAVQVTAEEPMQVEQQNQPQRASGARPFTDPSAGTDKADAIGFVDDNDAGHTNSQQSGGCVQADSMPFMDEEETQQRKLSSHQINGMMEYDVGQGVGHTGGGGSY